MKKINNQLTDDDVSKIFDACYDSFTIKETIDVLDKYKEVIIEESKKYSQYIPCDPESYPLSKINDSINPVTNVSDASQVLKLYTEKLAKNGSKAYTYYTALRTNTKKCPICGFGKIRTLDHFLSKVKYPQLCIAPNNLIPLCRDCNTDKGETTSLKYIDLPFHPYYEKMPDEWLECKIVFNNNNIDNIQYYCGALNSPLYKKYLSHFNTYHLSETFFSAAWDEMDDELQNFKDLLSTNENELLEDLNSRKKSYERSDKNGWRAALYRALINQFEQFCNYLKNRKSDEL